MKSIQRRFSRIKKQTPELGAIPALSEAVHDQRFTRRSITYWFNQLVPKDEYETTDKKEIIKQLVQRSQGARKRPRTAQNRLLIKK